MAIELLTKAESHTNNNKLFYYYWFYKLYGVMDTRMYTVI